MEINQQASNLQNNSSFVNSISTLQEISSNYFISQSTPCQGYPSPTSTMIQPSTEVGKVVGMVRELQNDLVQQVGSEVQRLADLICDKEQVIQAQES